MYTRVYKSNSRIYLFFSFFSFFLFFFSQECREVTARVASKRKIRSVPSSWTVKGFNRGGRTKRDERRDKGTVRTRCFTDIVKETRKIHRDSSDDQVTRQRPLRKVEFNKLSNKTVGLLIFQLRHVTSFPPGSSSIEPHRPRRRIYRRANDP